MMATAKQTGLIRPFNMDQQKYIEMYSEAPPDDLTLVLFLCTREVRCEQCCQRHGIDGLSVISELEAPHRELLEVVKSCIKKSAFPQTNCKIIEWDEDNIESEIVWDFPLEPLQENWIDSDLVYVQVGFHSWSTYPGILREGLAHCIAMSAYDSICVRSKSIDPTVQSALEVTGWEEIKFRLAVNDVYAMRQGIWCEPLVTLRNEVMIKVRAAIFGEDPEVAWKEFCDAGYTNNLELNGPFKNSHEEE